MFIQSRISLRIPLASTQSKLEEVLDFSNPTLKKMSGMIEMNKAMIDANNRELIPDLMVQGMFMRMPRWNDINIQKRSFNA
ncbi:MAG: hypothetical protein MZV64_64675 [Ignavibacteriales bacterium]|nr:hypothetical protein [Ignavibacteriales bacterium]